MGKKKHKRKRTEADEPAGSGGDDDEGVGEPKRKEPTVAPPPPDTRGASNQFRFLTPSDAEYAKTQRESYSQFVHEPADEQPAVFHARFRRCLHGIQSAGLLERRDITQPMGVGTRLAPTRVTRCLIGKPGITYFYLGLRMFAHPWSGDGADPSCKELRALSAQLDRRAQACGASEGSSAFNLVLLNRMVPEGSAAAAADVASRRGGAPSGSGGGGGGGGGTRAEARPPKQERDYGTYTYMRLPVHGTRLPAPPRAQTRLLRLRRSRAY